MTHAFDQIRERHQAKARLIAAGHSVSSVAHMLGTSAAQLERLMQDPTFRDLVSRYRQAESAETANQRFQLLCAA